MLLFQPPGSENEIDKKMEIIDLSRILRDTDMDEAAHLNVFDFIMIDFANKTTSSWLSITSIRCHSLNDVQQLV